MRVSLLEECLYYIIRTVSMASRLQHRCVFAFIENDDTDLCPKLWDKISHFELEAPDLQLIIALSTIPSVFLFAHLNS